MAESRICSVPGCGKAVTVRGYCNLHYQRSRGLSKVPMDAPSQTTRERIDAFIASVLANPTDDCVIWPFTRSAAGRACRSPTHGGTKYVHAQLCELVNGPRPSPRHVAAHSCGQGHRGCINPLHVRWDTAKGNEADKEKHGTRLRGEKVFGARFSEDDIRSIRQMWRSGMTQVAIAKVFGCRQNLISSIVNRHTWGHVEDLKWEDRP